MARPPAPQPACAHPSLAAPPHPSPSPRRRIAIEALGPDAFCVNIQPPATAPQPLGETVMRVNALSAFAWQPVIVAHYEWRKHVGDAAKVAALKGMLGLA
jgi:hypothetical protein